MGPSAWAFSAKVAWTNRWMRWLTVLSGALLVLVSGLYVARVVPAVRQNGTAILHYNIYLGIDDVRPWPWAFAWPALWLAVTGADVALAFGWYREDAMFSQALLTLAFLWSLAWAGALFYLRLMNV